MEEIEVKTTGQLLDELMVINIKIFMLIDRVMAGDTSQNEAQDVQRFNAKRNALVRAIDRRLGQPDIGGKLYAHPN